MMKRVLLTSVLIVLGSRLALGVVNEPEIVKVRGLFEDTSLRCNYQIIWSKVQGQNTRYLVQCSEVSSFPRSGFTEESEWVADTNYIFDDKSFNTKYYFRVKARAEETVRGRIRLVESDWSETKIGVVNSILSIDIPRPPTRAFYADVTWTRIDGRDIFYKVECSPDSSFRDDVISSGWINEARYVFKDLHANKKYYFRTITKLGDEIQTPSRKAYAYSPTFPPVRASVLGDLWLKYLSPGGIIIYVLVVAFVFGLYLIFGRLIFSIRNKNAFPSEGDFIDFVKSKWNRDTSIDELKSLRNELDKKYAKFAIGRILVAGLINYINNYRKTTASSERDRAIENTAAAEKDKMERWFLNALWAISSICPLLGLFGTVVGIFLSFGELSTSMAAGFGLAEAIPNLAKGINLALLTTIWGLGFGIPLFLAYYYFKSKSDWIYAKWQDMVVDITKEF